jgi:hypothetical protein
MLGMQPLDVLRTVNAAPTVAVRTHQIGNLPPAPGCVVLTAQPGDGAYSDPRHTIAVKTPAAPGAMCQLTMTLYRAFARTEFHSH